MKKLMIVAAVALMAIASQAAAFKWSAAGVKDAAGESAYSGKAVIHCFVKDALNTEIATYEATMSNGSISGVVIGADDSNFTANTMYSFYYTMTDAAGNQFDSRGWTEDGKPGTTYKTVKAQQNSQPSISFTSSGAWKTADVPEPTTGLLMLVGLAGLALRRRA